MKGKHALPRSKPAPRSKRPAHSRRKTIRDLEIERHLREVWNRLGDVGLRLSRRICGYPLGEQPEWYRNYHHLGFSRGDLEDPRAWPGRHAPGLAGLDSYERDPNTSVHMITLLNHIRKETQV